MWHLLAFAESQGIAASNEILAGVADPQFSRSANLSFQLPSPHYIGWMYAGAAGFTNGRINNGTFNNRGRPQLYPFNRAVLPPTNQNVIDLREFPIRLSQMEDFRIDTSNDAAGAENTYVLSGVWKELPNFNVNSRDMRWLRFTASVTATVLTWSTLGSITLDENLEHGRYGVYGMALQGTNVVAGRLLFSGQAYRPGCIGKATLGLVDRNLFLGGLGFWGEFTTYSLPQIETIENVTGASSLIGWLLTSYIGP